MSELDDVRAEVAALRDEVADTRALAAMADRDAAGVRAAINAINRTQNALRETQVEHGHILERVSDAVGVLVTGQLALEERADRQSEVLAQHGGVLAQLVTGQAEILRRLPPAPPPAE